MSDDWDDDAVVIQPVSTQKWNSISNNDGWGDTWDVGSGSNMSYSAGPESYNRTRHFTNRGGQDRRGSTRGRFNGGQGRNFQSNTNEVSETVYVASRHVGRVIGMLEENS